MKYTLHVFVFLFFTFHTAAQESKLAIEPTTVTEDYDGDLSDTNLDLELTAVVRNLTKDTLSLRWERVILDQPVDWETQVCDNNFCYEATTSTNIDLEKNHYEPVILLPEDSFTLIFHVLPRAQSGSGQFELPFSLVEAQDEVLEKVTFVANIGVSTSLEDDIKRSRIIAFPNPAVDYFQLSSSQGVDQIVIHSIIGERVKTYNGIFEGKKYDVMDLPNGLYMVSLINEREGVFRTLRLSKRVFRP